MPAPPASPTRAYAMDQQHRIENRDGMTVEWDAPIPMDDGVVLRTHTHPQDRPPEIFGGTNTLHFAPGKMPYVLLPVIPS